jgi:hypothetical protein
MLLSIGQVRKRDQLRPITKGLFHPKLLNMSVPPHYECASSDNSKLGSMQTAEEEVFQCRIVPQSLLAWQNGFWLWLGLFGSSSGNVNGSG